MKQISAWIRRNKERYLYEYPLRLKILLAFTGATMILFTIAVILASLHFTNTEKERTRAAATDSFRQTHSMLNNTFSSYEQITAGLARSYLFDNVMAREMEGLSRGEITAIRQEMEYTIFASILDHVSNTSSRVNVIVYFNDDFHWFNNSSRYFLLDSVLQEDWCREILDTYASNRTGFFIVPGEKMGTGEESLSMIRVVMDKKRYSHVLALLRLDIPAAYVNELITTAGFEGTTTAVCTKDGQTLSQSIGSDDVSLQEMCQRFDTWKMKGKDWVMVNISYGNYLVKTEELAPYDLLQVTLIPMWSINETLNREQGLFVLVFLLLVILYLILADLVSGAVTKRLLKVVNVMRSAQEDRPRHYRSAEPIGNDEISELIVNYNYLTDRMEDLLEQEYKHGQEMKNMELLVLQAQINPHFLYNTLDMLYWFAVDNRSKDIQKAVQSLGTFYRIGLSNGREVITMQEEIRHAAAYMQLCDMRFRGIIDYSCEVDPALLEHSILKVTLQPLLENAVSHGIREKDVTGGYIRVHGFRDGNTICLTVEDDGVGIDAETLEKLNQDTLINPTSNHGFGIHSVQARLRLYYGEEYGLTFESEVGKGTRVTIRIPNEELPHG